MPSSKGVVALARLDRRTPAQLLVVVYIVLAALALVRALMRDWMRFVIMATLLVRALFDELILPFRLDDFHLFYRVCTALVTLPPRRLPYQLPRPAEA